MIEFAGGKYYKDISNIFKECFFVTDEYVNNYFSYLLPHGKNIVKVVNNHAVSTMTLFPCSLSDGKNPFSVFYVFAVATQDEYRNHGFINEIFSFAEKYAALKKVAALILVPSEPSLFNFYQNYGFETLSYANKICLSDKDIRTIPQNSDLNFKLLSRPREFSDIFNISHAGKFSLHFGIDFISDIINFERNAKSIFIGLSDKDRPAFAAAYEQEENHILIKDFSVPHALQAPALHYILSALPADKYTVLTAPDERILDFQPSVTPYAMVKYLGSNGASYIRSISETKSSAFLSPIID